jgi:hypothetical protein
MENEHRCDDYTNEHRSEPFAHIPVESLVPNKLKMPYVESKERIMTVDTVGREEGFEMGKSTEFREACPPTTR